ncbi:lipid IV(A) 3-deoxy-D-manno-octulosonic acid transferase [Legionella taurinensis]|uniref:3-deoxy-D-manno-octulosonic acid transferase n=1 Tax=Legionella taurinensis TaxID=70611 RepID=A0A3A5L5E9_9GAMM|nr:lipid IV(A) 3-deoxy-D-manno-octulosonic acid transferase [Legionella taurinensis]RJT48040.1 3-deoxy-D-manno-octulosonic acid transferase [Legionella taurinensis]RJT68254.1 3-deoxy-D-manno-octulosonic acid transferase [Legionella taurinensis]STY25561.1 3-deoxy-D-manno-oct-2-ulosonic acid transferase [Legionella taurinensis]
MRVIYSTIWYLLVPFLLLRYWWKGRTLPAYRQRLAERFCLDRMPSLPVDIWLHTVSLGEVIAATPLVDELLRLQKRILITTMTPTGAERVARQFGDQVTHRYVPHELPLTLRRFFKTFKPRMGIIFETEIWPNMIHYATEAGVPLVLFNARLSERSMRSYKKAASFFKPYLNQFQGIYAQGQEDAQRFIELGAEPGRVSVLGNIKFDLETKHVNADIFWQLKTRWGSERTVVVIASTHENEEELILSHLKQLQQAIPQVVLVVVPRHPERFPKVIQLARQMGFNTGQRSDLGSIQPDNEVVVIDSTGELLACYQIADYAFVGGSFVPVGGHNVLEPIAMDVPVFSGPQTHNFKMIMAALVAEKAVKVVDNAHELMDGLARLHANPGERAELIKNASNVLNANRGAVARYVAVVKECLGE